MKLKSILSIGKKNGVVRTSHVRLDTVNTPYEQGKVSATVYPYDHPRQELNRAPWVNTSEVEEIRIITKNTEYVWKKKSAPKVRLETQGILDTPYVSH